MPELELYRQITDVLLAEHEASRPPGADEGYPLRQLACAWGLYAQIYRFGRAAVLLSDNGMGHETNVLVRSMLEHTVLLHWVVERGDEGVEAVIANQSKRLKGWLKNAAGTSLSVPPGVAAELTSDLPGIDERKGCKDVSGSL